EQRMEALARLDPARRDPRTQRLFRLESDHVRLAPGWEAQIESLATGDERGRIAVATGVQSCIGDLVVAFLAEIKRRRPDRRNVCLGGSLFFNSQFNSRIKQCSGFDHVFIPINPGTAGRSVGAALHTSGQPRHPVSPFLGPSYTPDETKVVLDNCKLKYEW